MNQVVKSKLEKFKATLGEIQGELERLRDDEQEKFDNLLEGLQQTESGQQMEAAAGSLGEAAEHLQSAIDSLDEIE